MRHPQIGTDARHHGGLCRRLRAQAMVHRGHAQPQPRLYRQIEQRQRIPASGYRQTQRLFPGRAKAPAEDIGNVPGQRQPSPCIACAAFAASADPGNRVPTSCSVTQASGVWPKAPSACPSFNSAGAACGPEGWPEKASR